MTHSTSLAESKPTVCVLCALTPLKEKQNLTNTLRKVTCYTSYYEMEAIQIKNSSDTLGTSRIVKSSQEMAK